MGTRPVSISEGAELVGGTAEGVLLGGRGFGWLVGGKFGGLFGGPRLGIGGFTSFVRVGGPRGMDSDVVGGCVGGREGIGGIEGREVSGDWDIIEGRDEGRYDGARLVRGAETTGMGGIDMGILGGVDVLGSGCVGIIMGVSVGGPATVLAKLGAGPGLLV